MKAFRNLRGKAAMVFCFALALALAVASSASAAIAVEAKDFTEPVETTLSTAVPIVVGFIAAVFGVSFLIKWVQRRASSAR